MAEAADMAPMDLVGLGVEVIRAAGLDAAKQIVDLGLARHEGCQRLLVGGKAVLAHLGPLADWFSVPPVMDVRSGAKGSQVVLNVRSLRLAGTFGSFQNPRI